MKQAKIVGPIQFYESQPLGSGSTANVFKGRLRTTNYPCTTVFKQQIQLAVKVIPHYQRYQNEVTKYLFQSEKLALTTFAHPNIVKCYGVYEDGKNTYIGMELLNGGTLKQYLNEKGKIPQKQAIDLIKNLLQGLCYIAKLGFIHRDLKPANIMIKQLIDPKSGQASLFPLIIDFGFSQRLNCLWKPQMFYNVGSPSYMAPESYNFTQYSEKSDLWSLGVIFYQMLTGQPIDQNINIDYFFNCTAELIEKKLSEKKVYLSIRSLKILRSILTPNQQIRPNLFEITSLINKLNNQYQTYNLIKKKKKNIETQNNEEKHEDCHQKSVNNGKQELTKKIKFFQVKNIKNRSRIRIPLFLDKNRNTQRNLTNERMISQRSPKYPIHFIPKSTTDMQPNIGSQRHIINEVSPDKPNKSTVISHSQPNIQIQRPISAKLKSHTVLNASYAEHNNLIRQRNIGQFFGNHQAKNFGNHLTKNFGMQSFSYRPQNNSFRQYISPNSHDHYRLMNKQVKFIVSA